MFHPAACTACDACGARTDSEVLCRRFKIAFRTVGSKALIRHHVEVAGLARSRVS